jgi:hypothetical protein
MLYDYPGQFRRFSTGWLLAAIGLVFLSISSVLAHQEPPKSHDDLLEQSRITERLHRASVKTELLHRIIYAADGSERLRYLETKNQYDQDGNFRRGTLYDSLGGEVASLEFVYDLERELQEQNECVRDSGCERTVFLYRSDHLVALALDLDKDGNPLARLQYAYLIGDTVVHLTKRNSDDEMLYTIDYYFSPDRQVGHMVRAVKKDALGKVVLSTEEIYDSTGLVQKTVFGAENKPTVRYEHVRRSDGQLISMKRYSADNQFVQETIWEYGQNNLPIRQVTSDATGRRQSCVEYQYETW